MDTLTLFGLFSVTMMLVCYAAEDRSRGSSSASPAPVHSAPSTAFCRVLGHSVWLRRSGPPSRPGDGCNGGKSQRNDKSVANSARRATHFCFAESCQAPQSKIFCFTEIEIRRITRTVPYPLRDVSRSSRYVGRGMRWTRQSQALAGTVSERGCARRRTKERRVR
jgi:hypothetical protein